MPMYLVRCPGCDRRQDIFRPVARIDDLPECCGQRMQRVICAPHVIADIQPYQAMGVDVATGTAPVISSRSEHRAFLRRNGYVEVGNEAPRPGRQAQGDFNVREQLTQAVRQVLPKYTV